MNGPPNRFDPLHVLPALHVCACFAIDLLDLGWLRIAWLDFPVSIPLVPLAWHFGYPLWWFGIIGTAWWYLLSWLLLTMVRGVVGWIRDEETSVAGWSISEIEIFQQLGFRLTSLARMRPIAFGRSGTRYSHA
jgi:hypothetical protein